MPASSRMIPRLKLMTIVGLGLSLLVIYACRQPGYRAAAELTGGDPERGRAAIRRYGCHTCHTIPGVPGADALVGPPLTNIASRMYVGGVIPNTPPNMMRWIQNPQQIDEKTAMPNLGVTEADARDITGYLYTLR